MFDTVPVTRSEAEAIAREVMSLEIKPIVFENEQPDEVCEMCGKVDECRPYGPNDENICFDCAMATPESKAIAERKMAAYIFGDDDE